METPGAVFDFISGICYNTGILKTLGIGAKKCDAKTEKQKILKKFTIY